MLPPDRPSAVGRPSGTDRASSTNPSRPCGASRRRRPRTSPRRPPWTGDADGRPTATGRRPANSPGSQGVRSTSPGVLEIQPERLRQHLRHLRKVPLEQQSLFLRRLEPVKTPRGHHELQPRKVTLASPSGEAPNRIRTQHRNRCQILRRPDHVTAGEPQRRPPPTRPASPSSSRSPTEAAMEYGPVS